MNLQDRFSKNPQMSNFMKIRPVGAELFHADWRTDRPTDSHDEGNSRVSQFRECASELFVYVARATQFSVL
jgi:hypothetical protein